MDEQTQDSQITATEAAPQAGAPTPKEAPVGALSALLLVALGALAILVIVGGLVVMTRGAALLAPPPPTAVVDGFAGVRQTAQEAFARGKAAYERGDLDQALMELDRASVNDPDHRQDIQQLLQQTLAAIRRRDAASATPSANRPTPASAALAPAPQPKAGFDAYVDRDAGISLLIPHGWKRSDSAPSDVGQGLVRFEDASGEARFTIARDTPAASVSPELYAATIETHMQELPGYSSEQVQLGNVGMLPAVKRVFRLQGRSPSGQEGTVRALQTVIGAGRTAYILTGEADSSRFDSYREAFETMTDSFRLR